MAIDDRELLHQQVQRLQKEIADLKQKNADLEQKLKSTGDSEQPVIVSEFEDTLRRIVQRTAMIVQSEKCVLMVRDRESEELYARPPAFGMSEEDIKVYRISDHRGISGQAFRGGEAVVFHNIKEGAAAEENFAAINVRNGVTVPLIIEKRDDENRLVDRVPVGVLHCFNKRYGGEFIEEDVHLLGRLARNAAAVIANAQMFQEVVEEKQKLVHTLESLTSGLLLVTGQGKIGQMNVQSRQMFSVPENVEPVGKPYTDIIRHEECLVMIKRHLDTLPEAKTGEEDEFEERRPDEITVYDRDEQEYIYQVHATKVNDGDKLIGTVFLFNDITDLRNVERMKTEFVSIVSHELRTPLTPMKGFVSMLLDDKEEDFFTTADRQEYYQIIDENVDRLGRLIDDLLNVSRIERMGAAGLDMNWEKNVDLRKAIEDVAAMQRGRTDKHTLIVDFVPEVITAETDPDKIQNVLHNLISNAIKYAPDGGEVRLIGRIEPATAEHPESILLGVRDSGIGLTESDLKKVGQKFFRTAQSKGFTGTGIGLFLVTAIAKRHNGLIWPESEGLGKGTTFWFRFPVEQPKEVTPEAIPAG